MKAPSRLELLEDALSEAIDLVDEAATDELSEREAQRLRGWAVPLDAMRSEVRRTRGQKEGKLGRLVA